MTDSSMRRLGTTFRIAAATAISALAAAQSQPQSQPADVLRFVDADVREVIRAILRKQENVVVADTVRGKVSVTVDPDADVVAALTLVLAALDAIVTVDEHGVLCIARTSRKKEAEPDDRPVNLAVDVRGVIQQLSVRASVGVTVGPGIEGFLSEARRTEVAAALATGARRGLDALASKDVAVGERSGIVRIVKRPTVAVPSLPIALEDVPIAKALASIAALGNAGASVEPCLAGRVTLHARGVPWRHLLALAADAAGGHVVRRADGSYHMRAYEPLPKPTGGVLMRVERDIVVTGSVEGFPRAMLGDFLGRLVGRQDGLKCPDSSTATLTFFGLRGTGDRLAQAILEASGLELVEDAAGILSLEWRR